MIRRSPARGSRDASRSPSIVAASLLLGLVSMLAPACGGEGSGPAGQPSACAVVGIAYEQMLVPDGRTFRNLVDDEEWSTDDVGVAAALTFAREDHDLGPYRAVVDHLIARYGAEHGRSRSPRAVPLADADVRRSADRLDGDLADGRCRTR